MDILKILLQAAVALTIINVWLIRKNQPTPWRGGNADSMRSEFETYGLPYSTMVFVGGLKLILAIALLLGIWIPQLTNYAAAGLALTLLGAIIAHLRVNDPLKKSIPAATLLALSTATLAM